MKNRHKKGFLTGTKIIYRPLGWVLVLAGVYALFMDKSFNLFLALAALYCFAAGDCRIPNKLLGFLSSAIQKWKLK